MPIAAWRGPGPDRPGPPAPARPHAAPPRRPPAQALALGRRVRTRSDGVRDARLDRRRAGRVVGGVGRRAAARAHASPRRPGADGAGARAHRRVRPALRGRARASRSSRRTASSTSGPASRAASPCAARCSAARSRAARASTTPPATTRGTRRGAGRSGVGVAESGARVAWNLVDGVHDGEPSERTVWVDGTPHHVEPLPFADDLSAVGDLRCEAVRGARAPRALPAAGLRVRDAVRALQRLAARTPGRSARAGE